jgi:hypothetical protein
MALGIGLVPKGGVEKGECGEVWFPRWERKVGGRWEEPGGRGGVYASKTSLESVECSAGGGERAHGQGGGVTEVVVALKAKGVDDVGDRGSESGGGAVKAGLSFEQGGGLWGMFRFNPKEVVVKDGAKCLGGLFECTGEDGLGCIKCGRARGGGREKERVCGQRCI